VFHQDIQTLRSGLKKWGLAEFFNRLCGIWIPDVTLFWVFGTASQTTHNSWRNSKQKFTKFYGNEDLVSKPPAVISFVFSLLIINEFQRNVIHIYFGFALIHSVIGQEHLCHFLNQSDVKPKPIIIMAFLQFPELDACYMYLCKFWLVHWVICFCCDWLEW